MGEERLLVHAFQVHRRVLVRVPRRNYVYDDVEDDSEAASSYQWYRSNTSDPDGAYTRIDGEVGSSYTTVDDDGERYLKFEVTPRASTGIQTGVPLRIGPTPLVNSPA